MQQYGTSMFYTVVRWHKLGEVESEYILHNFIVLAIFLPKFVKFFTKFDKVMTKTILTVFFWDTVYITYDKKLSSETISTNFRT